jgi:deoxynucleoside triphosphate triphosphohydrolase SAMHD1
MIVDALLEANPVYHFEDKVRNPAAYVNVTDNVLSNIENSKKPELLSSQNILKRIRCRELYRFLGERLLNNKDLVKRHVRFSIN